MRRRDFLAAGTAMVGALAAPALRGQPTPVTRGAVVIGVDKVGGLAPLRAARSGAVSMASFLTAEGFDVKLLVDDQKPVTAGDLKAAIKAYVNAGTLDQLVIYFAGHGFASATNSEFWLLSDALTDVNEAVSLNESRDLARQSGIPNVVFVSDACRSIAESLQATRVRGQIVFPNSAVSTNVACDVDRFLAARIGLPAWEVPVERSAPEYQGVYTACFLDAFKRPYASMVQMVDGKAVVPNRRLRHYLEQEVPKKARDFSVTLSQVPDAEICSDEPTFIGHVATADRATGGGTAATLSDVASSAIGAGLGGGTPGQTDAALRGLATASGFAESTETIARARGLPGQFNTRAGFVVSGQEVAAAAARPGIKVDFGNVAGSARIEVDVREVRGASVAIRFADGTGTVLAALDNFVGNVVVDHGRVIAVSYIPSRGSGMYNLYESESKRLDELHAAVATAARFGVFRIEGPKETRNRTAQQLAGRIRMLKGIDPTLGLYAAYAYADAGLVNDVRSVRGYMRGDLGTDLFDVAMLTGDLSGKTIGAPGGAAPFGPMLSQGWGMLRVRDVRLPKQLEPLQDHLLPSLWTTFDREGMAIAEGALRAGLVG